MTCSLATWGAVQSTLHFWATWLKVSLAHSRSTGAVLDVFTRFYKTGDPLATALAVALFFGALCFVLSLPTNNHSMVDKLWSIVPVYYMYHFMLHDKLVHNVPVNARLVIMSVLASVWGARLTYNFARKGGYRWSGEDYRWPYIRARVPAWAFLIFNLTFIAFYQHLLLLSIATPAYIAWQNASQPLNGVDALATGLAVFFILFETVADQQQWNFQTAKHAKLAAKARLTEEEAQGFISTGLFRYSRHPNFWAEQCLWWSMYLFGVAACGETLNWTIVAPIQLSLLFQGSTWLTEMLSAQKYPKYKEYQQTTSCLFPFFHLGHPEQEEQAEEGEKKKGGPKRKAGGSAARSTPRGRRASAAAAEAAVVTTEDEGGEELFASPAPPTATRRRARGHASRAAEGAAGAGPEGGEQQPETDGEGGPSTSSRPPRSARKSTRALESEEHPRPTRHSSRLAGKSGSS